MILAVRCPSISSGASQDLTSALIHFRGSWMIRNRGNENEDKKNLSAFCSQQIFKVFTISMTTDAKLRPAFYSRFDWNSQFWRYHTVGFSVGVSLWGGG